MSNQSDSFIDEVAEEVRRERFYGWLRRYGWIVGLAILVVVGFAAWIEWRQSQARAAAELRGEALLTALELPDGEARVAALAELPDGGEGSLVGALLLAAEQQAEGQADAAVATYQAVATDEAVPPLYRDLALLKSLMIAAQDPADLESERQALEGLAAPGAPFRLLARETLANAELVAGNRDAALAQLDLILGDAEVLPGQGARVEALREALGAAPAPVGEPDPATGASPAPAAD